MKVGDKVILVDTKTDYHDDLCIPLKLHNTYKISRILEYLETGEYRCITNSIYCRDDTNIIEFGFTEFETRGYSYNIKRFSAIKEERKLKLQKIFDNYDR